MPSRSRMRNAHLADIIPLTRLTRLHHLNIIGFGVADVTPLGALQLATLEAGLNPLSKDSLRAIGRIKTLRHLELGGARHWSQLLSLACQRLHLGVLVHHVQLNRRSPATLSVMQFHIPCMFAYLMCVCMRLSALCRCKPGLDALVKPSS